jgi:hypothetical protein
LSRTEKKWKPETGNRKLETGQFARFSFPVSGFLFFIPPLFGSGSAGLGRSVTECLLHDGS